MYSLVLLLALIQKPVFTNDDFPKSKVALDEPSQAMNSSVQAATSTVSSTQPNLVRALDLQFRLLDMRLAALDDPGNKELQVEMALLERRIAESEPKPVSAQDLVDLEIRKRYVVLKTRLVEAEKQVQQAKQKLQLERRRLITGGEVTPDGTFTTGLQHIRKATEELTLAQDKLDKIKVELQQFQEDARRAGASPRALK
ncbi:MAG: hypothetical protein RMM17_03680 [Acidobacteriota bacterium]|nr:hypothetical protein [Blastocatellia bacterium]MDW8411769.1 hypothetical protein [Acidobacteriota bacterium]